MSNRALAILLVGLLASLALAVVCHIQSDGSYAGLFVGVFLVPMAMITSALVCLACGLRPEPPSPSLRIEQTATHALSVADPADAAGSGPAGGSLPYEG
jgi:formate hydrogenlyase subunit 3/multisubunit Na+/H+ antiporter MnhD subunit